MRMASHDPKIASSTEELEPSDDAAPPVGEFLWRPAPGFGVFLRRKREEAGLTLRSASDELGIAFTRLQKMETGGRYRPPSMSLLARMANLYLMQSTELFREAGLDFSAPTTESLEADLDRDFEAIVLHPDLSPIDFDETWCGSFSPIQKQQWLEFSFKVEAYQLQHGPIVAPILAEAGQKFTPELANPDENIEQAILNAIEGTIIGGGFLYWQFNPGFGPYLRRLREERKLTLKLASDSLGLNFSALQRLETGDERAPSVQLLRAIAFQYGVHIDEVMREAGVNERAMSVLYRLEAWNRNFAALVTHPELRPGGMNARWMQSFSSVQQRQWVEFAARLEHYLERSQPSLKTVITAWRRARAAAQGTV